jgi:hypothetical protein
MLCSAGFGPFIGDIMSSIPDLSLNFGLGRSEFKTLHREQIEFLESRIQRLNSAESHQDRWPVIAELAARLKQEADDLPKLHPDPQYSGGRRAFVKALRIAVGPPGSDDPSMIRGGDGFTLKYTEPLGNAGQDPARSFLRLDGGVERFDPDACVASIVETKTGRAFLWLRFP